MYKQTIITNWKTQQELPDILTEGPGKFRKN